MTTKKTNKTQKKSTSMDFDAVLVLFQYFLRLFDKSSFSELSDDLKDLAYEGVGENNTSKFFQIIDIKYSALLVKNSKGKLNKYKLKVYDDHIMMHLQQIGRKRGGLRLKYFQYLSLLFTEIYLDRYFNDCLAFVEDLNAFLKERQDSIKVDQKKPKKNEKNTEEKQTNKQINPLILKNMPAFTPEMLNKLAFMCATGSGKTLIMHINILQYRYYYQKARETNRRLSLNKTILITPNEGLSQQHLEEFEKSDIDAVLFDKNKAHPPNTVLIIDINKLKEDGKVKTVSVDSFEQNNLVLVDEGHKGIQGDVWFDFRSRLSQEGFAFEYSATFRQALSIPNVKSKKTKDLKTLQMVYDYGKSIIFDYSYKFFYSDGYGKEYRIYNLKKEQNNINRLYLTGCLLSFYLQMKVYEDRKKELGPFGIERPLLIFVGHTVNATNNQLTKDDKQLMSDVEAVLNFLQDFIKNESKSSEDDIKELIKNSTGIKDQSGDELFNHVFDMIQGKAPKDIYNDILKLIFNTTSSGNFELINLTQAGGEIGLKSGTDYFGVINVGDGGDTALLKRVKNIKATENKFQTSLFQDVNKKDSTINILIGSRKFTEGWNSYRVSTMGLINFAKSEGSQAIQLFGRGVRLKGYQQSLKRSTAMDLKVPVPKDMEKLETLTIFGVKASYMDDFKAYLQREDLPQHAKVSEYYLKTLSKGFKNRGLQTIKVKADAQFTSQAECLILGKPEPFFESLQLSNVKLNHNVRGQSMISKRNANTGGALENEEKLSKSAIALVDLEELCFDLFQYKNQKGYFNVLIDKKKVEEILSDSDWYSIDAPKDAFEITNYTRYRQIAIIQEVATQLMKKYMDRFFYYHKCEWEANQLTYSTLMDNDKNWVDQYQIRLFKEKNDNNYATKELFAAALEAVEIDDIKAINFERHLYVPLIYTDKNADIEVTPTPLNEGEKKFVEQLILYYQNNKAKFKNKRLYLLRNKSKSGVGFFEADHFYPDFILWLVKGNKQSITFIDPKGLIMLVKNINNSKIQFHKKIKEIEKRLSATAKGKKITLDSFILSDTPLFKAKAHYDIGDEQEFYNNHVLFLEDDGCVETMMNQLIQNLLKQGL